MSEYKGRKIADEVTADYAGFILAEKARKEKKQMSEEKKKTNEGGEKRMREREIEQKLRREVEKRGGRCFKFLSSVSGVPDRILLLPGGLVIFVELKKEGEKPRKLQEVQMRKIRELGFRVRVVDSEQEIQELMREIEEEWKS